MALASRSSHHIGNPSSLVALIDDELQLDLIVDIRKTDSDTLRVTSYGSRGPVASDIAWGLSDLEIHYRELLPSLDRLEDKRVHKNLARFAYSDFKTLFPDNRMLPDFEKAGRNMNLCIVSKEASYPWSFLYTKKPSSGVIDPKHFLGARFSVQRRLAAASSNDPPHRIAVVEGQPDLVYGWCDTLPGSKVEADQIKELQRAHGVSAVEIQPISDNRLDAHLRQARAFLSKMRPRFIHLACHGSNDAHPAKRRLLLRNKTEVTQNDMELSPLAFRNNPVVFVNACHVGEMSPAFATSFASYFLGIGARCVIAPECKVDDASASLFAGAFFEAYFVQRKNALDAMYTARHALLAKGDLTGLKYALYGQASAQLEGRAP